MRLADPPVAVRVLGAGDGPPLVLVHSSGMSASTWAPLMSCLGTHRLIAFDLPGFGLSDAFDYSGRPLRAHSVAQLTSLLDALGLERAPDGFFEVVHEGMRQPGYRTAMLSHMRLAMRLGRPRPESFLSEAELRQVRVPVLMIWGDEDPYGGPEIGQRAPPGAAQPPECA